MKNIINLIVNDSNKNQRVDVFINKCENSLSRTRIKNLILKKKLKINDVVSEDPSKKVIVGDKIELDIPEPEKASLKPYDYKLDIVFEDNDLLIINKSAGISIHPGAGNYDNTIVNALMSYCGTSLSNIGRIEKEDMRKVLTPDFRNPQNIKDRRKKMASVKTLSIKRTLELNEQKYKQLKKKYEQKKVEVQ